MYLGKIVEIGPPDAIYAAPAHPYTRALLSAVPVPDPALERKRKRVDPDGRRPEPGQSAVGLPLPHALLALRAARASRRTAGPTTRRCATSAGRPGGRLPLRRGVASSPTSGSPTSRTTPVRRGTPACGARSVAHKSAAELVGADPRGRHRPGADPVDRRRCRRRRRRPPGRHGDDSRTSRRWPVAGRPRRGRLTRAPPCRAARPSPRKWHATAWSPPRRRSAARPSRRSRDRRAARGAGSAGGSGSPTGGFTGLGTSPRRMTRLRRSSGSGIGIADISACVYGCCGCRNRSRAVGQLGDPAQVHDRDPVADVLDDAHVVGDEQVASARARAGATSAG